MVDAFFSGGVGGEGEEGGVGLRSACRVLVEVGSVVLVVCFGSGLSWVGWLVGVYSGV